MLNKNGGLASLTGYILYSEHSLKQSNNTNMFVYGVQLSIADLSCQGLMHCLYGNLKTTSEIGDWVAETFKSLH